MKFTYLIFIFMIALSACKSEKEEPILFGKGNVMPSKLITGTAFQEIIDKNNTQISNVSFEPGSRTFWHLHPGGQVLMVTRGEGFYQEKGKPKLIIKKGDVVHCDPNVVHWHGATDYSPMTHIAVSIYHEEKPSQWFDSVNDSVYLETISN